jgi:predicted dehydrogenase
LCQEARVLIREGVIGQVKLVHGSFLQDWLLFPTDWNWRLEAKLGGELRAVSDIGTHWLDLVTWLTNTKVSELCADLGTVLPTRHRPKGRVESFQKAASTETEEVMIGTDDYASVLLHFENEARGVMTVSQVSPGRKARLWFEIDGSEGSLSFNSESPNHLWIGRRERACELLPKDPALQSADSRRYAAYPGGHPEGYPDTFVQLFKDFYAYLAAGDFRAPRSFPTFETGHEELVLCEAIAQSAQEKCWITVGA